MQMDKNVHVPSLDLGIQYHNIGFFQLTFRTRKRAAKMDFRAGCSRKFRICRDARSATKK